MKLKLTKDGHAVVRDGKPVYVHTGGREEAFDAPTAMKIMMGKHFESSPVMASLKIPHDVAAAFFGDSFRIEGGKLVALDKNGIQMYSGTRHGEAANFDEAFAQIVDRYPDKAMIQRKDDGQASGEQGKPVTSITRVQFDSLPPASRAKFFSEGGRIAEGPASAAPAPIAFDASRKTITRSEFDVMPQRDRAKHFQNGGKIVDLA
jgi:hypothetical protein